VKSSFLVALAAGTMLGGIGAIGPAAAQDRAFDIPAEAATAAIPEFARQAHLQIVAPADQLEGVITHRIQGQLDPKAALKMLIAGTGLNVSSDEGGIVTLSAGVPLVPKSESASLSAKPKQTEVKKNIQPAPLANQLEEIVVTAQKKRENLQIVPVAVTALTAEALDNARIKNVNDLSGQVPNLYVAQGFSFVASPNPAITLRGIQSNVTQIISEDSGIAMYVDGVYLGRALGQAFDVADIQRIEILRGPQATLYGRNSVGGAINVITQDPAGKFGIKQDLSFGNFGEFRSKTRVDLPEVEGLSAQLTYLHAQNDGYEKNLSPGTTWNTSPLTGGHTGVLTSQRNLGSDDTNAFFVAAKYAPPAVDDLIFNFKFDYTEETLVANGIQVLEVGPGGKSAYPPPNGTCAGNCTGGPIVVGTSPVFSMSNPFALPEDFTTWGISLTTDYTVNDWLKLRNIAAYRRLEAPTFNALSGSNYLLSPSGPNQGLPFAPFWTAGDTLQRQISEEFDITATSEYVDVTAGFFFYHENIEYPNHSYVSAVIPNYTLVPSPSSFQTAANTNIAGYGQATLHITDQIDFVAGLRESFDDRAYQVPAIQSQNGEGRHYRLDWLANLTYRPSPNLMTYAKVSTGYISGGNFHGVNFQSENITEAEVGAKSDLFDKRLRANVDWYWSDFRNFQAFSFLPSLCNGQFSCIINYGAEQIYGGEAEITAIPVTNLNLSANIGYTHTALSDAAPGKAVSIGLTPEWTLGLSAEYDFPQPILNGNPSIRIDANYITDLHFGPAGPAYPLYAAGLTFPARWVVNARATLADIPVGDSSAKISLWAKNLFDQHYFSYALNGTVGGAIQANAAPPTSYGIDISFKY
jgi:iron complex outermembrane receptor protein